MTIHFLCRDGSATNIVSLESLEKRSHLGLAIQADVDSHCAFAAVPLTHSKKFQKSSAS